MHTGTQFCRTMLFPKESFGKNGCLKACHVDDAGVKNYIMRELAGNDFRFEKAIGRISVSAPELFNGEIVIVVPIRHPARVYESFLGRNKTIKEFTEQWINMIKYIHPLNPWYIHMDLDDKYKDLARLEKFLDYKFPLLDGIYDWEVINTKAGTYKKPLEEFSFENIPQEYIDFYESTRLKNNR